jgi:hypothetical protein
LDIALKKWAGDTISILGNTISKAGDLLSKAGNTISLASVLKKWDIAVLS